MYRVILVVVSFVLCKAGYWRIFEEQGIPGWHAVIPFFGMYQYYKLTMQFGWFMLLSYIPIVGFGISILSRIQLAKLYEKGILYMVGLFFLPAVFLNTLNLELGNRKESKNKIKHSSTEKKSKEYAEPAMARAIHRNTDYAKSRSI